MAWTDRDGISKGNGIAQAVAERRSPTCLTAKVRAEATDGSVSNGRLFTMGLRGDREYVVAFDVATGKEVWATPNGTAYHDSRGDGPRGTPTVDNGNLYALGGNGDLSALDAKTGRVIWKMNVLQKFGGENIQWGISESPLVIGEKLLVNAGGPGASSLHSARRTARLFGKVKVTSQLLLRHASPNRQYNSGCILTDRRALGLDLKDGKLLWITTCLERHRRRYSVVRGNRVSFPDYGTGAALVEIKADGKAQEVYFTKDMRNHHSSSVLVGDYLYGFSVAF
jgi:outer membrane protein assembly factor BamB